MKQYSDYAKDKNNVYYQGEVVEGVENTYFQCLGGAYAKTDKNIYYAGKLIPNADVATFENINHAHAKDKNGYYLNGKRIKKNKFIQQWEDEKSR